jgi:hypothetical protein
LVFVINMSKSDEFVLYLGPEGYMGSVINWLSLYEFQIFNKFMFESEFYRFIFASTESISLCEGKLFSIFLIIDPNSNKWEDLGLVRIRCNINTT